MIYWAFFLSLALYFLSFPPFGLFPCAWIAPLPLLLVLKESSGKKRFLLWWLWGSIFFLASLYWLPGTMRAYGPTETWEAYSAYVALVLYLGLFWGCWGWWSHSLTEKGVPSYISFSSVLAFLELLRGHILTGFPWLLAAHSQCSFLPFIQGASIFGVYGVSFLLAWIWGTTWDLANGFRYRKLLPLLFPLCITLWGYVRMGMPLPERNLEVAIVQPNITAQRKWDPVQATKEMEILEDMTLETCMNSDLVVLPETAFPYHLFQDNRETSEFLEHLKDCKAHMLVGTNHWVLRDNRVYHTNRACLLAPGGRELGCYDKMHLVPFGEYVPLGKIFPFLYSMAGYKQGYLPGEKVSLLPLSKTILGVSICYEAIFPELARSQVRHGASLLINITNDAWFGHSMAPYQHLAAALFRAVEEGKWMVRCANTGISAFISPLGKVVASAPLFTRRVSRRRVGLGVNTFYTKGGDWLPILSGLLALLLLLLKKRDH